jgi:hypothetical protein
MKNEIIENDIILSWKYGELYTAYVHSLEGEGDTY